MALAFVHIGQLSQLPPCPCTSCKAHNNMSCICAQLGLLRATCLPQLAPDSPGDCQACITGHSHQLYSVGALVLGALPISLNLPVPASII